ncbi:MAG TPA: hypothetical protein VHL78_06455 [Actinomycetota bacterium]|nr:hypothetical protein [Actinomycetota bacterium]
MQESSVVLGLEDPALQEEVLSFLDRRPGLRVVAAAADGSALARAVRESAPDALVASPAVLGAASDLDGAAVLVVAERETTEGLRTALRRGARGFYLWPEEREALARDAEGTARRGPTERTERGRVVAVYGARGGAGVTFLATNLAAACAAAGSEAVLVDLALDHDDVAAALGVPPGNGVPTIEQLRPVVDELTAEHLDRVLYAHPRKFRVLLGPHHAERDRWLGADEASALVRQLRARFEVVVLHLPRTLEPATTAALEAADDLLIVVTLDVVGFREARRLLDYLAGRGLDGRCQLVVNRAARGEVVPQDAERVFGLRPVAVIRRERSVLRAQNRGELVAGRSTAAARQIARLARWALREER